MGVAGICLLPREVNQEEDISIRQQQLSIIKRKDMSRNSCGNGDRINSGGTTVKHKKQEGKTNKKMVWDGITRKNMKFNKT